MKFLQIIAESISLFLEHVFSFLEYDRPPPFVPILNNCG